MTSKLKKLVRKHIPGAAKLAKTIMNSTRHSASRIKVRDLLRGKGELFIEVGAGDKPGQRGWTTIDMTKNCDIFWDLRKGLPFPNESIHKIYSSHFFEHLTFKETQQFLVECKRALAPGGEFLICVPNARLYLESYINGSMLDPNTFFGYKPAYNHTTHIDYVNYVAYMDGEHKYMFDEKNLLYILNASGFRNVRLRKFDSTLDLQERDFESIYALAEK